MILKDLQELRDQKMADATALAAGASMTEEQRGKVQTILAEVSTIDSDIATTRAIEAHKAEQRAIVHPRPNPGESNDPEERAEVRNARTKASFRKYMQTGQIETRDLTVANSGVAIPILFDSQVIEAQKSYGELYDIVTLMKTDHGNPIKIVLDNDTSNGLTAVSVGTSASELDPTLSGLTLQVDNFTTGVIKIDNGLLSDAGFDLESFIRDKFAKRFFRGASSLIYNGDGGAVASLASGYASDGITSATAGTLAYKDFASAIGALDPAYQQNAAWAMSNATLAYVIGLTDSNARPLFLPNYGDAEGGFVGRILGKPVKLVTQMPGVTTGDVAVLFGDFKEAYTFRQQNPGLGILRLNELFAAGYETGFVGFCRVGGVVTDAGTHPLLGITIH